MLCRARSGKDDQASGYEFVRALEQIDSESSAICASYSLLASRIEVSEKRMERDIENALKTLRSKK